MATRTYASTEKTAPLAVAAAIDRGAAAASNYQVTTIAEPADAQYILDHTEGIVGFYGASSMEHLPVEPAIAGRVREFTKLAFRK